STLLPRDHEVRASRTRGDAACPNPPRRGRGSRSACGEHLSRAACGGFDVSGDKSSQALDPVDDRGVVAPGENETDVTLAAAVGEEGGAGHEDDAFGLHRLLQQLATVDALRQGKPDEHATLRPAPRR